MLPLSLGGMLNTILNSPITKTVSREEIGVTLGVSRSLESFSRVIVPSAGGLLLQNLDAWSVQRRPDAVFGILHLPEHSHVEG